MPQRTLDPAENPTHRTPRITHVIFLLLPCTAFLEGRGKFQDFVQCACGVCVDGVGG